MNVCVQLRWNEALKFGLQLVTPSAERGRLFGCLCLNILSEILQIESKIHPAEGSKSNLCKVGLNTLQFIEKVRPLF